jgi:predicted DNA-binding transcriptional regulator YafY
VARDIDRDDWRTFRVDRMSSPALAGHRFVRASEPDAAAMVADGMALAAYRHQAEVLLPVDVEEAASHIPRTIGALDATTDGTVLRIGADDLDWIARYLSGLPFDVEVRDPPELRAALRALGRRLQRTHVR